MNYPPNNIYDYLHKRDFKTCPRVSLTVYNLVGQQVAVLLNGMQNRSVHSLQFDAGHLASGLYLYRLETGNYSETRKMTLLK